MASRLLLDEMLSPAIAEQLSAKGHDVRAVAASPEYTGLPDGQILIGAAEAGRALVTANIKDFVPLYARQAASQSHAGLILISTKTFPQDRGFIAAVTSALDALLTADDSLDGQVLFLARG